MKTVKNVMSVLIVMICAFIGFVPTVARASTKVVGRIVVGPNTTSPYYGAWKIQVMSAMRAGTYPVAEATMPSGVEFLGSDMLNARHLVSSSALNPSWKGFFPPPSGFENATGTCLWLFMEVVGDDLTLASVSGLTVSSDNNLNQAQSFSTYGGSVGIDGAGNLITGDDDEATISVKKLYFGIKLKSFLATNQTNANQTMNYINNAQNYWVRFTVQGMDGETPWAFQKTLNTKVVPNYGEPKVVAGPDGFEVAGTSATVVLESSTDLVSWEVIGAHNPGDTWPLFRYPGETKRFYRIVYNPNPLGP